MTHGDWMTLLGVTIFFIIWGIATQKWFIMFLTWFYICSGVVIVVSMIHSNPIVAFILLITWIIYPIGRNLRNNGDV